MGKYYVQHDAFSRGAAVIDLDTGQTVRTFGSITDASEFANAHNESLAQAPQPGDYFAWSGHPKPVVPPPPPPKASAPQPVQVPDYSDKFESLQTAISSIQGQLAEKQETQDYATQIMDKAVTAGLEHQKWIEDKQKELLDYYQQRLDNATSDEELARRTSNLMEAGVADIMRAARQAQQTAISTIAGRGLGGSSVEESALAKIAGETSGKIGELASATTQQLLQTRTQEQNAAIQAMQSILSIPALTGYQTLAQAGALGSAYAVPSVGGAATTSIPGLEGVV
jgi:hypothetical protein